QRLGSLFVQAQKIEEALTWLKMGSKNLPGDAVLKWALADILISAGRYDEAEKTVGELESLHSQEGLLNYLRAWILVTRNQKLGVTDRAKWTEAAALLERTQPLLAADPNWDRFTRHAHLLLAECYGRLGELEKQQAAFSRALTIGSADDPMRIPVRLALA